MSKVQHGSPGLKSRCWQGCSGNSFWKNFLEVPGKIHPLIFSKVPLPEGPLLPARQRLSGPAFSQHLSWTTAGKGSQLLMLHAIILGSPEQARIIFPIPRSLTLITPAKPLSVTCCNILPGSGDDDIDINGIRWGALFCLPQHESART